MPKPKLTAIDAKYLNKQAQQSTDAHQLANLEQELASSDQMHDLESTVLKLSDYLQAVQMVVSHAFDHHVWVKAEIRNLSSKSGHYYFELAEKDDNGKVVASCRGTLWKFKAARILKKFAQTTGSELTRDITVLIKVSANMHPQYGFSLNIVDIDPSYTLGDLARQYAAIVERLTGEGLINANKQIPHPFDIENVIVIAPENAAGLGDFKAEADKLANNGACYFHYHNATFQGNNAPNEMRLAIIKGINKFEQTHHSLPDLLVIIRGGGAVGDLAYLNDYELAALVAEQPIPVWVGIGHERDKTILDEVAHTSFDTPSKVIGGIAGHLYSITHKAEQLMDDIKSISHRQLQQAENQNKLLMANIKLTSQKQLSNTEQSAKHYYQNLRRLSALQLQNADAQNRQLMNTIKKYHLQALQYAQKDTQKLLAQVSYQAFQQLELAQKNITHLREFILIQHPIKVVKRGFAIITNHNTHNVVTSVNELDISSKVDIQLKDGIANATITNSTVNTKTED